MVNKNPVLEWRILDASQKLLAATTGLCQALPDGDDLSLDDTQRWIRSTAAGALIGADLDPNDHDEVCKRALAVMLGALASIDGVSEAHRRKFILDAMKQLSLI